MISRPRRQLQH